MIHDMKELLGYIEAHLAEPLDADTLARRAHYSVFHFRRLFCLVCGMGLGEYLRRRRLSRAALDLQNGEKVLDVAMKYGYETNEGFSRAFCKFHGVNPSQARKGAPVKNFPACAWDPQGGQSLSCEIRELPAVTLAGFKMRFRGLPFGEERIKQEHEFYESTRGKQWLLFGAAGGKEEEYAVARGFSESGYDYYIAYETDEWVQKALGDPQILGFDAQPMELETIGLPSCRAAVFTTEKSVHPIADYAALRAAVMRLAENCDFAFADAPERVVYHWHLKDKSQRYIEICLPIV